MNKSEPSMPALPEPKPCPFCGGPVQLEESHRSRDYILGERRWWGVVCRNTTNLGGTCCIEQVPSASEEGALARWNRRTPDAQPLLERIKELEAQNRDVCMLLLKQDREGVMAYARGLLCKEHGGKFGVEVMSDAALSTKDKP